MGAVERATRWATACLVAAAVCGSLASGAAAFPGWEEPERTRPVTWSLVSVDGPRQITYGFSFGYCVGKPKPRIDHTKVTWHADSAVITVFVHYPAVRFARNEACVGLGFSARLHLAHEISARALYDGSASPPQWRSPPHPLQLHGLVALGAALAWLREVSSAVFAPSGSPASPRS